MDRIRTFGGQLFVPKDGKVRTPANKIESNFEKAHLEAYLHGHTQFQFGKDKNHFPIYYPVKEVWIDANIISK